MEPSEHERWRQHLEEELEAAFDLVRAGFRAQMRVLDQVRMAGRGRAGAAAPAPEPPSARQPPAPPAAAAASPAPVAQAPQPASLAERKRRPAGELFEQIVEALEGLPEIFDRDALLNALHPKPKKATLYQTLQYLQRAGWIERLESGVGVRPSRFRKLEVEDDEEEDGVAAEGG